MQLVAYGAQDVYLTGNPQITFFKVVYRRHTNFSMECIRQSVSGSLEEGKRATATISRNGDLVGQLYLKYKSNTEFTDSNINTEGIILCSNFGNALIRLAEVEIGGQLIDRHDGRFMQIYSDVTEENPSLNPLGFTKYQKMAGTGVNYTSITKGGGDPVGGLETPPSTNNPTLNDQGNWIPFQFWFCRNPGLALPLIALQYHEVKVTIELQEADKLMDAMGTKAAGGGTISGILKSVLDPSGQELWADYIYLDTDERRRFAQVSHEYLIEQVQIKKNNVPSSGTANQVSIDLNFNHPVKELLWVFTGDSSNNLKTGQFPGYSVDNVKDMFNTAASDQEDEIFESTVADANGAKTFNYDSKYQLTLNGQDRFEERDSFYFSNTQLYKHHTGSGSSYPIGAIMVYSFALKPEEHQPSGTCNFSRIDSSKLEISNLTLSDNSEINVYAINYNVLRIMSGMGGLAYSN